MTWLQYFGTFCQFATLGFGVMLFLSLLKSNKFLNERVFELEKVEAARQIAALKFMSGILRETDDDDDDDDDDVSKVQ